MFFTQSTTVSNNPKIPIYLTFNFRNFFRPLPEWYFSKESNRMNIRYSRNPRNQEHIPLTCIVLTVQAQVQGSYHQITVNRNQYKSSREEKKRVTESLRWAPSRRPECRRLCGKTLSGLLHLRYLQTTQIFSDGIWISKTWSAFEYHAVVACWLFQQKMNSLKEILREHTY